MTFLNDQSSWIMDISPFIKPIFFLKKKQQNSKRQKHFEVNLSITIY